MIERGLLPAGLAELPGGPKLGELLAQVDRSTLNGNDCVMLLEARARQVAHLQAELLADVHEVMHCPPGGEDAPVSRVDCDGERAGFEVAAALTLTRRASDVLMGLAYDLVDRLPAVHAALSAGVIDLPRARVLAEHTSVLDEPDARRVVARVLPEAGELTTGQLARRADQLVVAVAPEAIAARRAEAIAERRVVARPDGDGTGTLTVLGLPVERLAAAMGRVGALAQTARRDGDARSLDQLRADTVLGLLDGSLAGAPGARRGGVDLVVPLATLTGASGQPGEIPGWGPVLADIARQTVAYQPDAIWRFRVLDDTGRLVATGITRRRPTADQDRHIRARDRTCRAPGCRIPAARCELDHTVAYADGGPTETGNLGALCTYHHRAKHEAGWQLRQTQPGVFEWRSPLGHRYVVPPDEQTPAA